MTSLNFPRVPVATAAILVLNLLSHPVNAQPDNAAPPTASKMDVTKDRPQDQNGEAYGQDAWEKRSASSGKPSTSSNTGSTTEGANRNSSEQTPGTNSSTANQ